MLSGSGVCGVQPEDGGQSRRDRFLLRGEFGRLCRTGTVDHGAGAVQPEEIETLPNFHRDAEVLLRESDVVRVEDLNLHTEVR